METGGEKKRILGGMVGVGAVRLLVVGSPIILLPILLGRWGFETYGAWITASALAGLIAAVSVSILPLMMAQAALRVGAGDLPSAARNYRTLASVSALVSLLASGGAILAYWTLQTRGLYELPLDFATVAMLFGATCLAGWSSIFSHGLGAVGAYGLGNGIEAGRRAIELILTIAAVLLFDAGPFTAALVLMLTASAGLLFARFVFAVRRPWPKEAAEFDQTILRSRSGAMGGAVLLSASYNQAIVVAPRVVIENVLGAAEVVQFATIGNLVRSVRQIIDIFVFPFQPEFSFAFGSDDLPRARRLYFASSRLAVWISLLCIAGMFLIGPSFLYVLTGGALVVDYHLFAILSLATFVECAFLGGTVWLIAMGRVTSLALAYLLSGALSIGVALFVVEATGPVALAYAVLSTACLTGIWATHVSLSMLKSNWVPFLRELRSPPIGEAVSSVRRLLR